MRSDRAPTQATTPADNPRFGRTGSDSEPAVAPGACSDPEAQWIDSLTRMSVHAAEIRAALEGRAPLPAPYEVSAPEVPLPASLRELARTVRLTQSDVEVAARERVGVLSMLLHRGSAPPAYSGAHYIDRRS